MEHPRAGRHYPRSLGEFQAWFRTDADCLDSLAWLRWPAGFACPGYGHEGGWRHCQVEGASGKVGECSQVPSYHGYRFPSEIISHAVWRLYHRFALSFRDVEDLLAQRGVTVTYETIRQWCLTFGPSYARTLRRRRGRMGDTWHLDELFVRLCCNFGRRRLVA